MYNFVLVQSIVIQLSFFFIVVSGGLWLDQVYNGAIGMLSSNPTTYKAVILLVLIVSHPLRFFERNCELIGSFILAFDPMVGYRKSPFHFLSSPP